MHFSLGKLKGFLNNLKIRRQLYIIYFLAGLLPILVVGTYLILITRSLVLNQSFTQAAADNMRVRSVLVDVATSLTNMTDDVFSDMQLQTIISSKYDTLEECYDACRAYTKLNSYADNYTEISSIMLYVNNATMSDYGHFMRVTDAIRSTLWYQRAQSSVGGYQWMTVKSFDQGGTARWELQLTRKIPIFGTSDYAILIITVNNNFLKTRIETGNLNTEIAVNDNPVFFSNIRGDAGQNLGMDFDRSAEFFKYSGITKYNGQDELVEASTLEPVKSHDNIYVITVDEHALPSTNNIMVVCLAIVLLCLSVTLLMVILFSKTFSARITILRHEMHKVSCGDFNIIDNFNGNDELMELFADLKRMIESIKTMDAEIYNSHITKQKLVNHQQEMQFQMLASQINPHFLYNTLETIRMKAYNAGNTEIATAIKLLGKSMRYVLETNGKPVALHSELESIRIYLEIQKLRFYDRLDYDITVAEDVDSSQYMVLPLLLQPIVENALIHGLENKISGGFIQISVFREEAKLVISVSDNGIGMTEEEVEALRHNVRFGEEEGRSIGLFNIHQRIALYYGEQYGISIRSRVKEGTQILAFLPPESVVRNKEAGME